MKIAVWHNLPSGGGKRALYDHVTGLLNRGHQVESWRLSTASADYLPLDSLVREHVIPFEQGSPSLFNRLAHAAGRLLDVPGGPTAMERACGRCAEEIAAGGFDVLLANTCRFYYAPTIGPAMAATQPGLPRVLYLQEPMRVLHEALPRFRWAARAPVPWGRNKPRALWERWRDARTIQHDRRTARTEWDNAHSFDVILVNSYFSRESISRAYNLNARVCYLGVNATLFQPSVDPLGDFVLGLGDVAAHKRPDLTVRAVAALTTPRPILIWVGSKSDEATLTNLRSLAADSGVRLDVRLGVSDGELVSLLQHAQLVIYTPRLEPFGYVPLEANACGTPVVGVREGGLRETIHDGVNGFLCDPDPESLAAGMRRVLDDPATAARIRAEAPALVRREWSVEKAAARLEEELQRAINRPAATV